MKKHRVILRDLLLEDLPFLYYWRNSNTYVDFISDTQSQISDQQAFLQEYIRLSRNRRHQYIIEDPLKENPIGFIYSHSYSKINGHCYLNLFIDEKLQNKGYGPVAFTLMLDRLFNGDKVFKIYVEVCTFNHLCYSSLVNAQLNEEGRFLKHKKINGLRYDIIRYAVYLNNYYLLKKRLGI